MPSQHKFSSPRHKSFSVTERIVALITCSLFLCGSLPAAAQSGDVSTNYASGSARKSNTPAMIFTSPAFGATATGASVTVALKLSRQQDTSTLKVLLNGHDISARLHSSSCMADACTIQGGVRLQDGLKKGHNLLSASVDGQGKALGDVQRTRFNYATGMSVGDANKIQNYEPASVGIKTINPGGGNPWIEIDTGNTMNVTDPVSTFPALPDANNTVSVSYGDVQFSTKCTTQLQAIALDRQTPSVQEASACGNSVSDVESSLKSSLEREPNDSDLVILGTTHGNTIPGGFDTTSLGGTDYSKNFLGPLPQEYMIIGVPGAAAGSAHESYDVQGGPDTPFQYAPFLNGTLVLDQNGNYNYVPSDERAFQVVSNATAPSIDIGGQQYTAPSGGTAGAFWLFVVDRELLQPINYSSISGWTDCPYDNWSSTAACGAVFNPRSDGGAALANVLYSINSRNFVFLVAEGCPFDNQSQVSAVLGTAVQELGGVRYSLLNLNSSAGTCAYSLVSSNLPSLVRVAGQSPLGDSAALSANQFKAQGQTGIIHGFLARGNSGIYTIGNKDQGTTNSSGATGSIDYTFEQTASSQRTDWPLTDTAGHLAAYHDISYQLLTDPSIAETGSYLYDVRFFYTNTAKATSLAGLIDSRLAQTATNPVKQSTWDTATAQEFADARAELQSELQQLKSSIGYLTGSDGNGGVRGLLNGTTANILANAFGVADAIGQDQNNAAAQNVTANGSDILNLAAGVTSLVGPIAGTIFPEAGILFGVMSGALWTGSAALTPMSGSIPGPQSSYDVTLASIIDSASTYAKQMLSGFDGAVDNILTDPAKLETIGALTSNSDSHWSVQNLAQADSVSDVFADGARRALWLNVLNGLYGIREKIDADSNNPATFGSETYSGIYGKQFCASVYSFNNSGLVPPQSMISYPHIGDLSKFDTYFMGEGANPNQPEYSLGVKDFAISANLATLLTTSQTVDVGGTSQTGLNIPPAMLYTSSQMSFGAPLYFDPSELCDAKVYSETPDILTISGHATQVVTVTH